MCQIAREILLRFDSSTRVRCLWRSDRNELCAIDCNERSILRAIFRRNGLYVYVGAFDVQVATLVDQIDT